MSSVGGSSWIENQLSVPLWAGLEAQIRDLKAPGVEEKHIFHEKVSSVDADRPKLKDATRFIHALNLAVLVQGCFGFVSLCSMEVSREIELPLSGSDLGNVDVE